VPPRVTVTVTDGRGRQVRDGGFARWLASLAPATLRGDIAVALVSDRHIRQLNRQYRGKDTVTDVLSFPATDFHLKVEATQLRGSKVEATRSRGTRSRAPVSGVASAFRRKDAADAELPLGDIVIATGVAKRQAREAGHTYPTELRVLALHGLLHLLGYDHDDPDDNGRMARAEARLRRKGGLPEGLISRTASRTT
jgi:probable rRNA maturation factor